MELGLIGGIAKLGENINDNKNYSNESIEINNTNFIYNNSRQSYYEDKISNIVSDKMSKSINPVDTNIINNKIKNLNNINNIYSNNKMSNNTFYDNGVSGLTNSKLNESFVNNTKDGEMNFNDQFKPLLFDTNGEARPVNTIHKTSDLNKITSIERSLAIDGGWSAFNNKDYDMTLQVSDINELSHNNMVPHFKNNGSLINNYNEQNIAHKVELFSGSSKNFKPKNEILQENFKPVEADVSLVNGQKNFSHLIEDRYLPSKERRNELPFEQTKVGPGLNLDPAQSHRADGGRHDDFRVLPKGVDNLRSADNPKNTYEGIIIPGQKGSKASKIGNVYKRGPEKTKELEKDGLQKSGGAFRKPTNRDKVIMKNTNRKDSKPFIGPATFEIDKSLGHKFKKGKVQKSKKNQLKNKNGSHLKFHVSKSNPNECSYNIPETERDSTQYNEHPQGLHRSEFGKNVYDPNDSAKQTIKQTTVYPTHSGVPKGQTNKTNAYNPEDIARTTTKQTTLHPKTNVGAGRNDLQKVRTYDPKQIPNATQRETTSHNKYESGFESVVKSGTSYDPSNLPNPTIRGISSHSKDKGNMGRSDTNTIISYDPKIKLKGTQRETNTFNPYEGIPRGPVNKGETYDPTKTTRPTIRETTENKNVITNVKGKVNKGETYDPLNIPNVTNRNLTEQNSHILNTRSEVSKGMKYDPNDLAKDTMKELTLHTQDPSNVRSMINQPHHYDPNDILNTTNRESSTYNRYDGGAQGPNNKTIAHNPTDLARMTTKEQIVHDDRRGIGRGEIDKPHYFNPDDEAKVTTKQTTLYSDNGNIKSAYNKPHVFDPNNIPATTLKEMLVTQYNLGVAQGTISKHTAFNPHDIPADTLKQLLVINNYISNVNAGDGKGYLTNKFTAPDTLRQLMNIVRSAGGVKGYELPSDYGAEKNMEQDIRRETLNESREPTNRSYNETPMAENTGIPKLRDPVNIQRDPIRNSGNHIGNNYYIPSTHTKNNYRQEEDNRLDPEVLTQLIDNPLVNNLVNRR